MGDPHPPKSFPAPAHKMSNDDAKSETSSDDDMPALQPAEPQADGQSDPAPMVSGADAGDDVEPDEDEPSNKQSRSEKKSRKAIMKLGMKQMHDVNRVTIKKSKNVLFVIQSPEVFKGTGNTYIIFGEAKIEDVSGQRQMSEAAKFAEQGEAMAASSLPDAAEIDGDEDDEDEDAGDLAEDDINLVMSQASVSRGKAIKTLKENDQDVVNSIMALSS